MDKIAYLRKVLELAIKLQEEELEEDTYKEGLSPLMNTAIGVLIKEVPFFDIENVYDGNFFSEKLFYQQVPDLDRLDSFLNHVQEFLCQLEK